MWYSTTGWYNGEWSMVQEVDSESSGLGPEKTREVNWISPYPILTRHGCFQHYLHRFARATSPECVFCVRKYTALHTFFLCDR